MNETKIFFKMRAVFKNYWLWNRIYEDKKEQWMQANFSQK